MQFFMFVFSLRSVVFLGADFVRFRGAIAENNGFTEGHIRRFIADSSPVHRRFIACSDLHNIPQTVVSTAFSADVDGICFCSFDDPAGCCFVYFKKFRGRFFCGNNGG